MDLFIGAHSNRLWSRCRLRLNGAIHGVKNEESDQIILIQ